jgi:multicomponent Na+:H+ antiporter subunit G
MNVLEIIAVVLMALGSLFTLLAAVGVVRLPDVYCRLSATSKAAPFGIGLVLVGTALVFDQASFSLQAAAVGLFLVITAPVAAHALARAAYRTSTPAAEGTLFDVDLAAEDRRAEADDEAG